MTRLIIATNHLKLESSKDYNQIWYASTSAIIQREHLDFALFKHHFFSAWDIVLYIYSFTSHLDSIGSHSHRASSTSRGWGRRWYMGTLAAAVEDNWAPLLTFNLIPAWISNHMLEKCGMKLLVHSKLQRCNGWILEWISNFVANFIMYVITYPCRD